MSESAVDRLKIGRTPTRDRYDAVVVGSGPNGLAAAVTLARQGRSVLVVEAAATTGGGMRSAELTLPGFVHDVCSSIHALAVVSPFFQSLPLAEFGLRWAEPEAAVAHPLPDGRAVLGFRSLGATCDQLGADGAAYRRLFEPLLAGSERLFDQLLGPLRLPRCPLLMTRFGRSAVRSAVGLARARFGGEAAQALFAGHAAHSVMPLEKKLTAAVGMMLALTAHAGGWPVAVGGSQQIANAMAGYLQSLGGEIVVNWPVGSLAQLPASAALLLDVAPPQLSQLAGRSLPQRFHAKLQRYRFGPAAFKLDWALDAPIPWRAEPCGRAATVHVAGGLEDVARSERAAWNGEHSQYPFVLVAQPTVCDPSRSAPHGKHTAWGYCHVPHASRFDMTDRIEAQIERFAPGFRERILQRHCMSPADFQSYNANYVGGDITGGVMDIWQLFTRPTARRVPYSTPNRQLFLCSASTPPGAGVHGMCGYYAARAALRSVLRD